jgi:hypothetical protein
MATGIRVGIVGTQFAARFHWEGLTRVYGVPVEVVGVTSKTADSRDTFARNKGIRSFATFEGLCDAVDVVDICSPPSSHEPLAVQALKRGKHVIVEKPFTGYYGADVSEFRGNVFPKEQMLREAMAKFYGSLGRSLIADLTPPITAPGNSPVAGRWLGRDATRLARRCT